MAQSLLKQEIPPLADARCGMTIKDFAEMCIARRPGVAFVNNPV
jgi:hypothetical protein